MKNEWSVSIFSTSSFRYLQNDSFFPKLINLYYKYLPSFDLQTVKVIFSKNKNSNNRLNLKKKKKKQFYKKLRNSFPLNIMYEGGFIYILFGFILGLYLTKKNNVQYIYSTYSPYSNHFVSYLIKTFNKNIYWVADFRDLPLGDNDSDMFFKSFQQKINALICKKADAVTTISNGMKKSLLKYNNNIHVITNGFDANINDLYNYKPVTSETFNIVYTGSLYEGKRDASILFQSVKRLLEENRLPKNLKLIYAGKDGLLWEEWSKYYQLEKYIENHDELSKNDVQILQEQATINLMLTWSTKNEKGILTGKLFEYLNTLKPIICIVNGIKDKEIEDIFNSLNCGKVLYCNEIEKIMNEIEKIYIHGSKKYNLDELKKYTSTYLTQKLERILLSGSPDE